MSKSCLKRGFIVGFYLLIVSFGSQTGLEFSPPRSSFFSDIDGISIAPGTGHVCVLELKHGSDIGGRARCWGNEEDDGKTKPPTDVTFVQLASGISFTCGITIEQTVMCWGGNMVRQVPGLFTQITASELYACGVKTDGSIMCWGQSHVMKETPKPRDPDRNPLGARKYVQVSCSTHHCCALDTNAHAHCWGHGHAFGEMIPPSKKNITSIGVVKAPTLLDLSDEIKDNEEDEDEEEEEDDDVYNDEPNEANDLILLERLQFKQISVGEGYSCGIILREDSTDLLDIVVEGDLVCWGGERKHGAMPHHVVGPYKQVSVGPLGVCAIHSIGNYSEGKTKNDANDLRDGKDGEKANIVKYKEHSMQCWGFVTNLVSAQDSSWDQVSVGTLSVCGVTMMSELECWGTGLHEVTRRPMDLEIA